METVNGIRTFNPADRRAWRQWLSKNHTSTEPVCVILLNKKSKHSNLSYEDAVEEALCFGWIDNKGIGRDEHSSYLQFVPRKENSNWSKLNKERAEKLIRDGQMTKAGQYFIDIAKDNGRWDASDAYDTMPEDLAKAFQGNKTAFKNFESFPPSSRRMIIQWVIEAKRPETRLRRIEQTIEKAMLNERAKG